jgi:peptidoglycan hydrolase-like protein with peptidoglycan-binding domain
MKKFIGVGFLFLALCTSASIAHASGLTDTQIQAIVGLLNSFGADATTISNVTAALHGQGTSGNSSSNVVLNRLCTEMSRDLSLGSIDHSTGFGYDVSDLQTFLGIAPTTGYFGTKTQAALKVWQGHHGVNISGKVDHDSRVALCGSDQAAGLSGPTGIASSLPGTISASPTYGTPPLMVTFTTDVAGSSYYIDFGNGSQTWIGNGPNAQSVSSCPSTANCTYTTTYTYPKAGYFVAHLESGGKVVGNGTASVAITVNPNSTTSQSVY